MNKKELSERDICTKYITPAIQQGGWDIQRQIREEYVFTDGRVIVRGNMTARGKKKRADYLLFYRPNTPLAVVEAKDNNHSMGAGMQQAINYGMILDVPFVYASNGDGFIEHDMLTGKERELTLEQFPSPDDLWARYRSAKKIADDEAQVLEEPYHFALNGKAPRYYQMIAVNRTLEAIAKGKKRMMLVMATGTGKTYTAFQIIWRLWQAKRVRKVLFLADRNILIDQTMQNDFAPFGKVMTKVENRTIDTSYEIFLSLYHQLSGNTNEMDIFRQFSRDFFDLIVIDECHRGSAKENSRWRRVLKYFSSATQIGLTATPVERDDVSNAQYFGRPIYTYSLKQGIQDGFLAPYKVVRVSMDRDVEGYRPPKGKQDKYGEVIEDREYNASDYDREMVLEWRTKVVARRVSEFLKKTDRFSKTIVFCVDIDHAERMRQALVNENSDLVQQNPNYIMRITGDNDEGKAQLDNFIDEDSRYPTIVTTSKLLTTGVDAKTCKLIVLDNLFGEHGMTEFKQIIGRGTRLKPEYGKEYFTILDFRNASRLFADPNFDGEPVSIHDVTDDDDDVVPPDDQTDGENNGDDDDFDDWDDGEDGEGGDDGGTDDGGDDEGGEDPPPRKKYYLDDVVVKIVNERVMYYGEDGSLVTESLKDYSKKGIMQEFATLDDFIRRWNSEDQKQVILDELQEHGVLLEALRQDFGDEFDEFDLICHVAFDQKPLTRSERARKARRAELLSKYSETARAVLEAILNKYQDEGRFDFEDVKVLEFQPFSQFGNPMKIASEFGGKPKYIQAIRELERNIYA